MNLKKSDKLNEMKDGRDFPDILSLRAHYYARFCLLIRPSPDHLIYSFCNPNFRSNCTPGYNLRWPDNRASGIPFGKLLTNLCAKLHRKGRPEITLSPQISVTSNSGIIQATSFATEF